jgi:hypothetical protein
LIYKIWVDFLVYGLKLFVGSAFGWVAATFHVGSMLKQLRAWARRFIWRLSWFCLDVGFQDVQ